MVLGLDVPINESFGFVVLLHEGSLSGKVHHDLCLEVNRSMNPGEKGLEKFEIPSLDLTEERLVLKPQGPVRKRYLSYQGEMDGNRGVVSQAEVGTYIVSPGEKNITFMGQKLEGTYDVREEGALWVLERR